MIRIEFLSDTEGLIQGFTVKGHAGYNEAGKDIVCAAVSAVTQTAVIGLTDVAGINPKHIQHNGFLQCVLPRDMNQEQKKTTGVILRTMLAGLQSIKGAYPNLISIQERMVD